MFERDIKNNIKRVNGLNYLIEMPTLYDFIYSNLFQYEKRANIIRKNKIDEDILVLGCGSGLLVEKIENDFNNITCIDIDEKMLELCDERCDKNHKYVKKDIINNIDLNKNYSLITLLGNVTALFSINQIKRLFKNINKISKEESVFIFDFISNDTIPNSKNTKFNSNDLTVKRNSKYQNKDDIVKSKIKYEVYDKNKKGSFTENFSMNIHNIKELKNIINGTVKDMDVNYPREIVKCSELRHA